MSYLILNGEYSNRITGLLVQKLAPVSLPPVRTQVETIDGRDGDIVSKLGYGAYDKTVQIGLYGEFDVNQIIAFFATQGTVTFSDEPDKYYHYQILNQIDFNRLLRLRSANVVFHVQPFKYAVDEAPATGTDSVTVTNAGNTDSRPRITLEGSGTLAVYLNDRQMFTVEAPEGETIIIDTNEMNAYDESGNLLNRNVTGNYDSFRMPAGENTVSCTGATITLENYSRWL